MILTKTNGAAGYALWGSIHPLVAHVFHPSDIVSNPFTLFSFEGSWFLHWALPRHTFRSVTSLISSTSISSSADASSRPFPWECWVDPRMQTHQGIDLSWNLIINKSACASAESSRRKVHRNVRGECWCPDWHVPLLVLSEHVRITLGWQTNCCIELQIKLALARDRCHLNLAFRRFHDLRLCEWPSRPSWMKCSALPQKKDTICANYYSVLSLFLVYSCIVFLIIFSSF